MRRRDRLPDSPAHDREALSGLRSDPLPAFAGAQDQRPDQAAPLAGWELPDAFPTLQPSPEGGTGKAASGNTSRSFGFWRRWDRSRGASRRGEGRPAPEVRTATRPSNTLCCAVSQRPRPNSSWISIPTCLGPTWRPRPCRQLYELVGSRRVMTGRRSVAGPSPQDPETADPARIRQAGPPMPPPSADHGGILSV